jgi:hypothetical protein
MTSKLKEWGFVTNNYDSCVCNKLVGGNQLTVTWHVDDLKISHADKKLVDNFIHQMES